ncbi:hypothetical protein, partial [Marinifilum sp. D737]|uniref:hypothetical protein n=1 Tax=Marinifilum sp. D737 TaxID=2969628 RepID=UPI002274475E
YLQVKPLLLRSKVFIVRFMNKLSRVVQQAQKLNCMGGDAQFESLAQLRNTSKPPSSIVFIRVIISPDFLNLKQSTSIKITICSKFILSL